MSTTRSYTTTTPGPCGCCPPPGACELVIPNLLLDGTDTPVADEAAAVALLAAYTKECLVAFFENPPTNVAIVGDALLIDDIISSTGVLHRILLKATLVGGADLTLDYTDFDDPCSPSELLLTLELFAANGSGPVASASVTLPVGAPDGAISITVPSDGCYYIRISATPVPTSAPCSIQVSYALSSSGTITIAPISAAYMDGVDVAYEPCV